VKKQNYKEQSLKLKHMGSKYNIQGGTVTLRAIYRVFQKELYDFERVYKLVQRTCTVLEMS
jgi:hypothetical protein